MKLIPFRISILQHKTVWETTEGQYTEVVCVAKNLTVSFTYYMYTTTPNDITLRNLFVTEQHRYKGIAALILNDMITYCVTHKINLNLWVDTNKLSLISMYIRRGFNIVKVDNNNTYLMFTGN